MAVGAANPVPANTAVDRIRGRLDHPVIDSDGHLIEYLPVIYDLLEETGGADAVDGFRMVTGSSALTRTLSADDRRQAGAIRTPWWGLPAANTLDRATALLPALLYERLPELGIDVAVLYPTYGLTVMGIADDDVRRPAARAFNRYFAEVAREHGERLIPVAVIPTFTPDEALEELDYAVGELGLRAVMMGGLVTRPLSGENESRAARWVDGLGLDSLHDYDPVWARCVELGVSPTFHSTGMGWGSRVSPTNYVCNHIGNFAAAAEAVCRSLFFGGAFNRFPELRWAFHEGGAVWAVNLYSDICGHWEKRNAKAVRHYDPAALDRVRLRELFAAYGSERARGRIDQLNEGLEFLSDPDEDPATLDEFAACGIAGLGDVRATFDRLHFGCEADDPLTAVAFDRTLVPQETTLRAVFASDIGHWDVPDIRDVLPESYELVEKGVMSPDDFRAFTFDNPISLWCGTNPRFFEGTSIESKIEATSSQAASAEGDPDASGEEE